MEKQSHQMELNNRTTVRDDERGKTIRWSKNVLIGFVKIKKNKRNRIIRIFKKVSRQISLRDLITDPIQSSWCSLLSLLYKRTRFDDDRHHYHNDQFHNRISNIMQWLQFWIFNPYSITLDLKFFHFELDFKFSIRILTFSN